MSERVAEVIASVPSFHTMLREVRRWDPGGGATEGVIWLDPEPSRPFVELTEALAKKDFRLERLSQAPHQDGGDVEWPRITIHSSGDGWAATMGHKVVKTLSCTVYVGYSADDAEIPDGLPQCALHKKEPTK